MLKKTYVCALLIVLILMSSCCGRMKAQETIKARTADQTDIPFGAGINIGNSLDSYGTRDYENITDFETLFHNCVIRPTLFSFIKESGFSTVRIPVTWMDHLNESGIIDSEWIDHVGEVVTWALESGLYVIIDVHHDTWTVPSYSNKDNALDMTNKVWRQIAEFFRDYDQKLVFEGFNEPRLRNSKEEWKSGTKEAYEVLNLMNEQFVNTVRATGGNNENRCLLITGYRNGFDKEILDNIRLPEDDNLVLAVHAYVPYEFASNKTGASSWSSDNRKDTSSIDDMFENLVKFSRENDIQVVVTECGALDKDNQESRALWCRYFADKARETSTSLIWWDNNYPARPSSGYSLMDRVNETIVNQEIVDILTKE